MRVWNVVDGYPYIYGLKGYTSLCIKSLAKSKYELKVDNMAMQSMSILKSHCAIHWIVIYPVNSTVHLLNNRGVMYSPCARTLAQPLELEMRATLCHLSKVPASLRWVFVLVVSSFLFKAWIFVSAIIIFTAICLHRCGAPTPSLLLTMF